MTRKDTKKATEEIQYTQTKDKQWSTKHYTEN
jgi:hypothetical protein